MYLQLYHVYYACYQRPPAFRDQMIKGSFSLFERPQNLMVALYRFQCICNCIYFSLLDILNKLNHDYMVWQEIIDNGLKVGFSQAF